MSGGGGIVKARIPIMRQISAGAAFELRQYEWQFRATYPTRRAWKRVVSSGRYWGTRNMRRRLAMLGILA
jgi:hypothetical protein